MSLREHGVLLHNLVYPSLTRAGKLWIFTPDGMCISGRFFQKFMEQLRVPAILKQAKKIDGYDYGEKEKLICG